MKIYKLTSSLVVALLVSSPLAVAETEYPASDFQPKVVYQDEGYQQSSSGSSAAAGKSAAVDPKYPAANFQPEVLYQDTEYKHAKGPVSSYRSSDSSQNASTGDDGAADGGLGNYLIGLVVLALVGFVLLRDRSGTKKSAKPKRVYSADSSGLTGVARYVQNITLSSPSGVARYLEKHAKETGVQKYLRRQQGK